MDAPAPRSPESQHAARVRAGRARKKPRAQRLRPPRLLPADVVVAVTAGRVVGANVFPRHPAPRADSRSLMPTRATTRAAAARPARPAVESLLSTSVEEELDLEDAPEEEEEKEDDDYKNDDVDDDDDTARRAKGKCIVQPGNRRCATPDTAAGSSSARDLADCAVLPQWPSSSDENASVDERWAAVQGAHIEPVLERIAAVMRQYLLAVRSRRAETINHAVRRAIVERFVQEAEYCSRVRLLRNRP